MTTTRRAFKTFKRKVLNPVVANLSTHLLAPLVSLVANYMDLPTCIEEHFKRIISSQRVLYSSWISPMEEFIVRILPGSRHDGIDFALEYHDSDTMLRKIRRIIDPPGQSLVSAVRIFDIPIAFTSRIDVAMHWILCIGDVGCDGTCVPVGIRSDTIVSCLWESYRGMAYDLIGEYLDFSGKSPQKQ